MHQYFLRHLKWALWKPIWWQPLFILTHCMCQSLWPLLMFAHNGDLPLCCGSPESLYSTILMETTCTFYYSVNFYLMFCLQVTVLLKVLVFSGVCILSNSSVVFSGLGLWWILWQCCTIAIFIVLWKWSVVVQITWAMTGRSKKVNDCWWEWQKLKIIRKVYSPVWHRTWKLSNDLDRVDFFRYRLYTDRERKKTINQKGRQLSENHLFPPSFFFFSSYPSSVQECCLYLTKKVCQNHCLFCSMALCLWMSTVS